jgi:LysR family transcriptional activator of mexEF-oprN operon
MSHRNFKRIDLNLFVVFEALMRTRNTTRAAEALFITQPGVSHALKRLRALLKDELFLRTSRGLVPTARAEALWQELMPTFERLETVIDATPRFDPAKSDRVFRIGLPSSMDVWVTPLILQRFAREAPGANLIVRPVSYLDIAEQLDSDRIDVGVSYFDELRPWHAKEFICMRGYLCLFDGKRLGIKSPIPLRKFIEVPHVLASFSGERRGVIDDALARRKLTRRVLVTSSDFASLAFYLKTADALAVFPEDAARTFAKQLRLSTSRVPVEVPKFELSMAWHAKYTQDAATSWFRHRVKEIVLTANNGQRQRQRLGHLAN